MVVMDDRPGEPAEGTEAAAALAAYALALGDAIEAALAGWVVRKVTELIGDLRGPLSPAERAAAEQAGAAARDAVMPPLRALLATDVDEQRGNPLAIVRRAVVFPTGVLRRAGVPPVVRDEVAERLFPDDVYDLTPAAFGDLDTSAHEPGLVWGAAKAHVVLVRRKAEGRR
jgi:hypothetical protein